MRVQLLTSSVCRFIEAVATILTTLILTPFLLDTLGADDYGLWILILSILGWFSVFELGLPWAVQRSLTIALEQADEARVNRVFSCGLVLFGALGLATAAGTVLLAFWPRLFKVDEGAVFTLSMLILSLKVFWDLTMNAFHGFYSGLLRFDIDANLSTLATLLRTALIFLLLRRLHVYGAVIAVMVSDLLLHMLRIYYAKKLVPSLRFGFALVDRQELRALFDFSKHVVAMSFARVLYTKSDPFIVSQLFNLASVALYSIPSRLCAHVASLTSSVVHITQPIFTKRHARNENMEDTLHQVILINLFVSCLFYLPLLALSEPFIALWVGPEFRNTAVIANILVFAMLCQAVSKPVQEVLFAQANHQSLTWVNLVGAVLNVGLAVMLGQLYGLVGIALGVAAGFFLADFCLHLLILRRYNAFAISGIFFGFLYAALLLYGVGYLVKFVLAIVGVGTWTTLVLSAIPVGLVALCFSWFTQLTPELRGKILQTVREQMVARDS